MGLAFWGLGRYSHYPRERLVKLPINDTFADPV